MKRVRELLHIRSGEGFVTSLMFFQIFGILSFYYILKPLRSGLFLKNFPSAHLPYAYFLTAFFAGSLATVFFKLSKRVSAIAFLTATNVLIIATLSYFRWAMGRDIYYLPYIYYVYVQIVSVLSTAQFWLLAGYIFDNQQSKRIFPLLGAGAIAGATAGSFVPGFLSERLSTASMLLICMAVCAVLILLSQVAWRHRRPEAELTPERRSLWEPAERAGDLLRMVSRSRHLLLIALLIFLTLIASQISEWQVNDAAKAAYTDLPKAQQEKEINELFGRFYFVTNILGIVFQLTLSGLVVRRLGIGAATVFLPLGLLLTSAGVLAVPGLKTALLALGSNSVFRYSVNRVGMELLYLPLSPEVRKRIKVFLDVFVDRFGRAVAGLIILALTSSYLPMGLRGTAAAIILLTGLCVVAAIGLQKSYAESFRKQLARREMDLGTVERFVTDPESLKLLVSALDSTQERQVLYALRLLQSARGMDFSARLLPLLDHRSPHIREAALRALAALPRDYRQEAEKRLLDSSDRVRQAAVDYLCSERVGQTLPRLESLLKQDDPCLRVAAARHAAEQAALIFKPSLELVQSLLSTDEPRAAASREAAAHLAALLPAPDSLAALRPLLRDPSLDVVAAAVSAAGRAAHLELVFAIVPLLAQSRFRRTAREALLAYGHPIAGTLGDMLADPRQDLSARREIPWVLGRIPTKRSMEVLLDNLDAGDSRTKYLVIKALNHLREVKPNLALPGPPIVERILAETRAYYETQVLCASLDSGREAAARSLLSKALSEKLERNLEIIFRLLGLQYPQKDIYSAYTALKNPASQRHTSAVEFLDSLLHKNLKATILPLLEETSAERIVDRAHRSLGIPRMSRDEALAKVLKEQEAWVKACALHEVGTKGMKQFAETCRLLAGESDRLVRETAEWALRRCA